MTAGTKGFSSFLSILAILYLLCGCSAVKESDSAGLFSIMTYNLDGYGLFDRDGDGQPNNPKPGSETRLIHTGIASISPDILAVQEIGNRLIFADFRSALEEKGLEYAYYDYLEKEGSESNIAVLSRYPITARYSSADERYSIGDAVLGLQRGIIDVDIEISSNVSVKVIVLHLKSKQYHPHGQTEMRRNEARIVAQRIRRELNRDPELNLIVLGTLNDQSASAPVRDIMGAHSLRLEDLKPTDCFGDHWTHFSRELDCYQRVDYILASPALHMRFAEQDSFVVNRTELRESSDHRPLVAAFRTK